MGAAALHHVGDGTLGAKELAADVDVVEAVELLWGDIQKVIGRP